MDKDNKYNLDIKILIKDDIYIKEEIKRNVLNIQKCLKMVM